MQLKLLNRESNPKVLRRQNQIPVVCYGSGIEPISASLNKKEFVSVIKKAHRTDIFELEYKGDTFRCIVKEVQKHPVTSDVLHVDFYKFDPNVPINVEVPIILKGESKGVKSGGDLYQPRKKIALRSLPEFIPHEIVLDVTSLEIGDSIHAFDLKLPEGVKVSSSRNFAIVAIVGKTSEEQAQATEEEKK